MSRIQITHGMASVELEGMDTRTAADRYSTVAYPADDLLEATARALSAANDGRSSLVIAVLEGRCVIDDSIDDAP